MLKIFSLKTISAGVVSITLLLGALAATPVTSAFAKPLSFTNPKEFRGVSYSDRNIDNDGDEMNESTEFYYLTIPAHAGLVVYGHRSGSDTTIEAKP